MFLLDGSPVRRQRLFLASSGECMLRFPDQLRRKTSASARHVAARDTRRPGSQGRLARTSPRVRRAAAHRADHEEARSSSSRARCIRRSTVWSSKGCWPRRMGRVGQQPPGQVLPADAGGPPAAAGAADELAAAGRCDGGGARHAAGGGVTTCGLACVSGSPRWSGARGSSASWPTSWRSMSRRAPRSGSGGGCRRRRRGGGL